MIKKIDYTTYEAFYKECHYDVHYQDPRWLTPIRVLRIGEELYGAYSDGQLFAVFIASRRTLSGINKLPFIGNDEFVSRRGPVMHYSEKNIKLFTSILKKFMKDEGIVFTNITPNVIVNDIKLSLPSDQALVQKFIKNGWIHEEFHEFDGRIPNRECIVNLELPTLNEVEKTFKKDTMRKVRKAFKNGVVVEKIAKTRISEFMYMFEETGNRDGFSIQTLDFYEKLLQSFGENSELYIAKLDLDVYISEIKGKKDEPLIKEQIINDRKDGQYFTLGLAINLYSKGMAFYESGATTDKYRETMGNYALHYTAIKEAFENDYTMYNFGSVSGNFDPKSHLYGLYYFKSRFAPTVTVYAGEFELYQNRVEENMVKFLRKIKRK